MHLARPAADTREQARERRARSNARVVHELKCWPQFFEPIACGEKRHDLRRATDRSFLVGDHLLLREFDPETEQYTGRTQIVEVTYITSTAHPCALSEAALNPDFCILSIVPIAKD